MKDEIKTKDIKIKDLEKKLLTYSSIHNNPKGELDNKNLIMQIQLKDKQLKEKEIELEKLRKQLSELGKFENRNSINQVNDDEKISVMIISQDDQICSSYNCNINEPFVRVEERLYNDYPEYKKKDNVFLGNGTKVMRFLTMKENKMVKDGIKIVLVNIEE